MEQVQQSYPATDVETLALIHSFSQEAEMRWHDHGSNECLNTAIAIQFLHLGYLLSGNERRLEFLNKGRRMAERMKLFGVEHDASSAATFENMSQEARKANAHFAWGHYNWIR